MSCAIPRDYLECVLIECVLIECVLLITHGTASRLRLSADERWHGKVVGQSRVWRPENLRRGLQVRHAGTHLATLNPKLNTKLNPGGAGGACCH